MDYLLKLNEKHNNWKYSLDNVFCPEVNETPNDAMGAAFEALELKFFKK